MTIKNDREFNSFLSQKIYEDNNRPLEPELPRPDEGLVLLKHSKKIINDDVLIPPKEVGEPITEFKGPYQFLSNFYPCKIYALNRTFPTVEHAYQAAKRPEDEEYIERLLQASPGAAKAISREYEILQPDWDTVTKFTVMRMLIEQKFTNDENLMWMLLGTRMRHLEEGNTWGDKVWGTDLNVKLHPLVADINETIYDGQNHLGKILMETRKMIKIGMAGHARIVE